MKLAKRSICSKCLLVCLSAGVAIFTFSVSTQAELLCVRNKARVTGAGNVILKKHVKRVAGSCPSGFTEVANVNETVLPSGQTLRGYYYAGATAAAGFDLAVDSITFAQQLSAAPVSHYIEAGDAPPAECPGTAAAPEADPGHLCVYEGSATNVSARNTNTFSGFDGTSLTMGAGIYVRSDLVGDFFARGTWAVTAP